MKSRLMVLTVTMGALLVAGCGSGSSSSPSGSGADPAKVVPATAPLYVELVIRPDGDLRSGATDALKKLLNTEDPGKKLTDLINNALAKDNVTWDDLKSWVGTRVGGFATSMGASPTAAAVLDVTDMGKARDALLKIAEKGTKSSLKKETYKGVEITSDDKSAVAFLDTYAVLGTPSGVRLVIDTAKGGRPLTDVADYTNARTAVAADSGLGMVYIEPQGLIDVLSNAVPSSSGSTNPLTNPQTLGVVRQLFARAGRAAGVSLHADGSAVRVNGATIGAPAGASGTAATDAVAALPSDAWLAFGFGDLGASLTRSLAQLSQLASLSSRAMPDFEGMMQSFEQKTGINLQRDFLSWMGDGAFYASGRSFADIGAVLTIATKDPAKSRKAVGILEKAIKSAGGSARPATVEGYDTAIEVRSSKLPISFFIAANDKRVSLGVNPAALTAVLAPTEKFGDSSAYGAAVKALGGDVKPQFILDTPTIVGLVEGFGLGTNPSFAKVKPYLDVLGPLSFGTARDGDLARYAFALGLR